MEKYKRFFNKAEEKKNLAENIRKDVNKSLRDKNPDLYNQKLFSCVSLMADACELITKSVYFMITGDKKEIYGRSSYRIYKDYLKDKIVLSKKSEKNLMELYKTQKEEFKEKNFLHTLYYNDIDDNKDLFSIIDIEYYENLNTIYAIFRLYYTKQIIRDKNSEILDEAYKYLDLFVKLYEENIDNPSNCIVDMHRYSNLVIDNLLNFILITKENLSISELNNKYGDNIYKKALIALSISDIDRFKETILEAINQNLENLIKIDQLNSFISNLKDFYNYCQNILF